MAKENNTQINAIKDRFLTFMLDNEKYGVEILSVKEIIGFQQAIKTPNTPDYVEGVINLRGNIIPVIDLRKKLKMPEKEKGIYTAIIIANIHDFDTGFVVDLVQEVASIGKEDLKEPPEFGASIDTAFLSKMAKTGNDVIMIIDLTKIFDTNEISSIDTSTQSKTA